MHYQNEVERMLVLYAIEYQHGLHGKVPRTRSVGCRYDDSNTSYDEGNQRTSYSQVCRKVEAEECQVVVQEIAQPDAQREAYEQWNVTDVLQRDDSLPDTTQCSLYLIIYR